MSKTVRNHALQLAVVVGVTLTARASFADHYEVPTGSMEPTVATGSRVVVDKRAYGLRVPLSDLYLFRGDDPQRGHVVVLRSPVDGTTLLKRVIAVPGDEVMVRNGLVEIDGNRIGPNHLIQREPDGGPDFGPKELRADEYLVMGDNRGQSFDGRSFGPVQRSAIHGRALWVWAHGEFARLHADGGPAGVR